MIINLGHFLVDEGFGGWLEGTFQRSWEREEWKKNGVWCS